MKNTLINILLMGLSLLVTFTIVETSIRFYYYYNEGATLQEAYRLGKIGGGEHNLKTLATRNVGLAHVIRLSKNRRIIYELMPNITAYYVGAALQTNSLGFRDKEYAIHTKPNVIRFVGLGDSVMFGQGASQESTYLSVLESRLNAKFKDRVEIINTAVPGYNTAMEVETLKAYGLQLNPDFVLLGLTGNDHCLPNFVYRANNYFSLSRSYLSDLIKNRGKLMFDTTSTHLPMLAHANSDLCDENQAPVEYRDMVGERMVIDALNELNRLSKEHSFRVVVVYWGTPNQAIASELKRLGFDLFDTQASLAKYVKDNNIGKYDKSHMVVSDTDAHPSDFTHGLVADWLFEYLVNNKAFLSSISASTAH